MSFWIYLASRFLLSFLELVEPPFSCRSFRPQTPKPLAFSLFGLSSRPRFSRAAQPLFPPLTSSSCLVPSTFSLQYYLYRFPLSICRSSLRLFPPIFSYVRRPHPPQSRPPNGPRARAGALSVQLYLLHRFRKSPFGRTKPFVRLLFSVVGRTLSLFPGSDSRTLLADVYPWFRPLAGTAALTAISLVPTPAVTAIPAAMVFARWRRCVPRFSGRCSRSALKRGASSSSLLSLLFPRGFSYWPFVHFI